MSVTFLLERVLPRWFPIFWQSAKGDSRLNHVSTDSSPHLVIVAENLTIRACCGLIKVSYMVLAEFASEVCYEAS